MAQIFQYQQLAFPPQQSVTVLPDLSWAPRYPDMVPHRRTVYAPAVFSGLLGISGGPVRVSQLPVETIFQYGSVLTRLSQLPVETVFAYAVTIRQVRVSQLAVEICYPFGCFVFVPPPPPACPAPDPGPSAGDPACASGVLP